MDLGPDVMRDKPNYSFTICGCDMFTSNRNPIRHPIDPDRAVGIEHDLDDVRVFEPCGNRRSQRRAQHARAARHRF
jgi:hypothetical protein